MRRFLRAVHVRPRSPAHRLARSGRRATGPKSGRVETSGTAPSCRPDVARSQSVRRHPRSMGADCRGSPARPLVVDADDGRWRPNCAATGTRHADRIPVGSASPGWSPTDAKATILDPAGRDVGVRAVAVACGGPGASGHLDRSGPRSDPAQERVTERPLPSPGTRFEAVDSNATQPPSGERLGAVLARVAAATVSPATLARVRSPDRGDPGRTRRTDRCRPVTARPRWWQTRQCCRHLKYQHRHSSPVPGRPRR